VRNIISLRSFDISIPLSSEVFDFVQVACMCCNIKAVTPFVQQQRIALSVHGVCLYGIAFDMNSNRAFGADQFP
jgi:hypothetical protein